MDQLRMRRHNLYQRCKVDNIALPQLTEEGAEGMRLFRLLSFH
jgi:hypothetical protein